MLISKKVIAFVVATAVLLSTLVIPVFSEATEFEFIQSDNETATISCNDSVKYVYIDRTDLLSVDIADSNVHLKRLEEACGITRVTVVCESGRKTYEVALGYTTFVFSEDRVTVFPGSDSNYEIVGINSLDEEYEVTPSTDASGYDYYTNTDTYKISVEIKKKGGSYVFLGENNDMSVSVKKAATSNAYLYLSGLNLSSSFTSPLTVKKESTASVYLTALEGHENFLSDTAYNNADNYPENLLAESAVIKAKSYASLYIGGKGTLNVTSNSKNAVKVGEYGYLDISDLTLNVTSAKNGISSDNLMQINSGVITAETAADAIRSDPDAVDADAGCAGNISILGGTFRIVAGTDGIQAAQNLTVSGGSFEITTCGGYLSDTFDGDTSSAKGLKTAFSNSEDSDDTSEATNLLTITGGSFVLNTADDSIHSDAYVVITGGTFDIYSGDDAVHGDSTLDAGIENGADCSVIMNVNSCYEGLEAGNVYIRSGAYRIISSDDGVNAAGGSDATDTNTGFNPGQGSMWPGGGQQGGASSTTVSYSINVSGGLVYVQAGGDGIDSNGDLNITGGTVVVWGGNGAENPLDLDGKLYINGATVFGAGSNQMMTSSPITGSQSYTTFNTSISAGKTVTITQNNVTVVSLAAPSRAQYVFYSTPSLSSCSVSSGAGTALNIPSTSASHDTEQDSLTEAGCETNGSKTWICTLCGATQNEETEPSYTHGNVDYKLYGRGSYSDCCLHSGSCANCDGTLFALCADTDGNGFCDICLGDMTTVNVEEDEEGEDEEDEPITYTVSFETDGHCSIDVYYTKDYTAPSETDVLLAVARDGSTGEIDISGDGQVNFLVIPVEGYEISSVTAEGDYKNLKGSDDTGVENLYRLTKVAGAVTVTVTCAEKPADSADTGIAGDLNEDGSINSVDAVLLAQVLAGWNVICNETAADCNGDGSTDSIDAVLLAQYLAGWDVTLGKSPEVGDIEIPGTDLLE